jgi:c-di-GMP-binding flagellar brake protein YcgR
MANIEKIQGDAILQLFKGLQQDKIPLQIKLPYGDYEHISYLKDIRKQKRTHYFLIDYNKDFQKAIDDLDDWWLRIEFTGPEGILYAFQTNDSDLSGGMIWIKFPDNIHRYQRRGLFRLEAPHGTRLYFNVNQTRYKLLVINVSLSGTLGVLVSLTKQMEQELKLNNPKILENVELVFPAKDNNDDDDDATVNIKRCQIIRRKRNPQTQKYECAMEFTEITGDEQKKLTELFYQWQRDYLRKRRPFKT